MSHLRPSNQTLTINDSEAVRLVGQSVYRDGKEIGVVTQAEHSEAEPVLYFSVSVSLDQIGGITIKDGKVIALPPVDAPA